MRGSCRIIIISFVLSFIATSMTACQSSQANRLPGSVSSHNSQSDELRQQAQNLANAFAHGSEPRQMLFQHFMDAVAAADFKTFERWIFLQRQFVFLQLLNRQLDTDPLLRKTTYEAHDHILKIEKILSSHIDSTVTEKELEATDKAIVLSFLSEQTDQVRQLIHRSEVKLASSDKIFILRCLDNVAQFIQNQEGYIPMMSRSLASDGYVGLFNQKDWVRFEKLAFTAITVTDHGEIFGGSQAIQKAMHIQYGMQFIIMMLNPRNQFIGKPVFNL